MNYAGHENFRRSGGSVANAMCDLRTTMNEMERRYSFNADTCRNVWCVRRCFAQTASDGGIYRNSGTGFLLQD